MCGLFGIISREPLSAGQISRARAARDTLTHRGPDQHGEWMDATSFHGHRRLSIIDLSEDGRQPMEAGGVVITVNGEIYNFEALRDELMAAGHKFRSKSDSEVVLHGYREWGIDGVAERLDGMYAATIHDSRRGIFHALRDRAGIKPLYYALRGGEFAWASELKALRSYFGRDGLEIDPEAAIDFLTYKYVPAPKSIYFGIAKLPQAHLLTLDIPRWQLTVKDYWQLPVAIHEEDEAVLRGKLDGLLAQSVKEQLISDVPIGLLLSGGIDSSAIAVHAAARKANIASFAIGFPGPLDESEHAETVARHLGLSHHHENFEQFRTADYFSVMAELFDEPFGDSSALPTSQVCAFARRSVTVALSGDGGDECFGGYNRYKRFHALHHMGRLRRAWRYLAAGEWKLALRFDPVRAYALLRGGLPPRKLKAWKQRLGVALSYDELWAYRAHYRSHRSPLQNARQMDFHGYLPENILTKLDRTSMHHSLETRPPFLSRKLIEFAFSLPDSFLMQGTEMKRGLKATLARHLPSGILSRPKKGFGIPVPGWKKKISAPGMTLEETFLDKVLRRELL